jgi:hypothetical protein
MQSYQQCYPHLCGKSHGNATLLTRESLVAYAQCRYFSERERDNEPPAADLATVQLLVKHLLITLARR